MNAAQTIVKVAETQASLNVESAIREIESVARTLQKVAADLRDSNAAWWDNGVDTKLMNALIIKAAAAQANLVLVKNIADRATR